MRECVVFMRELCSLQSCTVFAVLFQTRIIYDSGRRRARPAGGGEAVPPVSLTRTGVESTITAAEVIASAEVKNTITPAEAIVALETMIATGAIKAAEGNVIITVTSFKSCSSFCGNIVVAHFILNLLLQGYH